MNYKKQNMNSLTVQTVYRYRNYRLKLIINLPSCSMNRLRLPSHQLELDAISGFTPTQPRPRVKEHSTVSTEVSCNAHLHEKSTMGLTWNLSNQTSRRTATGLRLELMHSELETRRSYGVKPRSTLPGMIFLKPQMA